MPLKIFKKIILKIFNKNKYRNLRISENKERNLLFYKNNIQDKLIKIKSSLENKKEISFLHSGHLGDLMYSLPLVKELSKNYKCSFFIEINKKTGVDYGNHPSGDVFINERTANLLIPLLANQDYMSKVSIYNNEVIDIDLNLFRDIPINFYFHSVRWYMHLTGSQFDMSTPALNVKPHDIIKNKIVIMRSPRYRNMYIDYKLLKNTKNIVCIGLKSEFEDLKRDIPYLEFYDCKDFLEMAQIIKSCKFFIGNLCFAYSIAETLKVPRLLEASPEFPVVFPVGVNAFDFYHQIHFEKFYSILNK